MTVQISKDKQLSLSQFWQQRTDSQQTIRVAMHLDRAYSEVIFKEKVEEEIKMETTLEDATIRFDF